jgi:ABC-type transport system substrate-binding protein
MIFALAAGGCGNSSDDGSSESAAPHASTDSGADTGTADPAATTPDTDTVETSDEPQYGGVIRCIVGDTSEPFGLPWTRLHGGGHSGTPVGDTLVLERSDGTIEPWIAESWELDMESKEYVFKLR